MWAVVMARYSWWRRFLEGQPDEIHASAWRRAGVNGEELDSFTLWPNAEFREVQLFFSYTFAGLRGLALKQTNFAATLLTANPLILTNARRLGRTRFRHDLSYDRGLPCSCRLRPFACAAIAHRASRPEGQGDDRDRRAVHVSPSYTRVYPLAVERGTGR